MKKKPWVFMLRKAVRKKEITALRRSAFQHFLRGRFFSIFLCLFSILLFLNFLVCPAVKITREDGKSLYLASKTYQTVYQTILRDGEASLGTAPSLNFKSQSVLTFSFRLKHSDPTDSLLRFCGDSYAYREVYSIGQNTLCAVLSEECSRAESIISKAMEDTLLLFPGHRRPL